MSRRPDSADHRTASFGRCRRGRAGRFHLADKLEQPGFRFERVSDQVWQCRFRRYACVKGPKGRVFRDDRLCSVLLCVARSSRASERLGIVPKSYLSSALREVRKVCFHLDPLSSGDDLLTTSTARRVSDGTNFGYASEGLPSRCSLYRYVYMDA